MPQIIRHWRRRWQPTPVLLPGKFHGLRSLVGYSPWGCKESDTTERLHFTSLHFTSLVIGKMQLKTAIRYHFTATRMTSSLKKRKWKNPKCCWCCGRVWTLVHCWWEFKIEQPLWEMAWLFLQRLKRVENKDLDGSLYTDVLSSIIPNCQEIETNQVSINRLIDKMWCVIQCNLIQPHSGMKFWHRLWQDKPWKHAQCNKPDTRGQTLYGSLTWSEESR